VYQKKIEFAKFLAIYIKAVSYFFDFRDVFRYHLYDPPHGTISITGFYEKRHYTMKKNSWEDGHAP